jgi:hypothetical protein
MVGPRDLSWVPVPFVADTTRAGAARCVVLYQNGAIASKRAAGAFSQRRENRTDNFFTFVTWPMHTARPNAQDGA